MSGLKKNCSGPRNFYMRFDICFCEVLNENYQGLISGRKYRCWILSPRNFDISKILSLKSFGNLRYSRYTMLFISYIKNHNTCGELNLYLNIIKVPNITFKIIVPVPNYLVMPKISSDRLIFLEYDIV